MRTLSDWRRFPLGSFLGMVGEGTFVKRSGDLVRLSVGLAGATDARRPRAPLSGALDRPDAGGYNEQMAEREPRRREG